MYDIPRHPASDACLDCFLSSVIPSWMDNWNSLHTTREKLQLSSPQKLPVFLYSFGPQPIISRIWNHKWCPICRLLQTSESANSLLKIQAISKSKSSKLPFEFCTQNSELRGMKPATKFCNWIRWSTWEYRYSLFKRSLDYFCLADLITIGIY